MPIKSGDDLFLPDDYKVPVSGGGKYMKFIEGDNRFRVLSKTPLRGWLGWTKPTTDKPKGQPVRKATGPDEGWNVSLLKDNKRPRHFITVAVWNYATKQIEVLEITQNGIQTRLVDLSHDEDYGHPRRYDIVVNRKGTTINDTEYAVTPKPPKPMATDIADAWDALQEKFDLTRLFSGGDPFGESMTSGNGESFDELNPPPMADDDIPF
jgi:hypothetical protein